MHRSLLLFALALALPGQETCTSSAELKILEAADQKDREPSSIDWEAVTQRDAARRSRVFAILTADAALCADDLYSAALILQHGDKPEHFLLAHVLATAAVAKGSKPARWLSAATLDRYLQSVGQPQVFGTQYRNRDNGPWNQDPFDTKLMPEAIRKLFEVPSLDRQQKRLKEMNAAPEKQ